MAPASGKRKRPDRQTIEDDGANRPSPYKPERSRITRKTSQGLAQSETVDGEPTNAVDSSKSAQPEVPLLSDGTETPAAPLDTSAEMADANGNMDHAPASSNAPYKYIYVMGDAGATWTETAGQDIVNAAVDISDLQLVELFTELVRSTLDKRITGTQAGLAIRHIIAARESDEMDVPFLVINTLEMLFDANFKGDNLRELVAATGIDQQRLRDDLDVPFLVHLGLVRNTFERMKTRKTTNALYRQANFNLLREESEGYAKLITEYFNTAQEASNNRDESPFMAEDAFQRVKALIGAFDLDVGRVLDVILDISANLLVKSYPFFIKFYRASSWWPLTERNDGIRWIDQGFDSLPSWALPRSGLYSSSEEEKDRLALSREGRDARFWSNVAEIGMNAFFQLGAKEIVDFESVRPLLETELSPELDARGNESNPAKRVRINQERKYMLETRRLPSSGNSDAAQLLGFKLRFYASSARDATDLLSDNLVYLAALLIKIGFVSLRDLYPHLHPSDVEMKNEKTRLESLKADKEAKERPGGGMNALLMAGALTDDALPPSRRLDKDKSGGATPAQDTKDESKQELPTPENQKILLLKALLLIGALPEALYILGRFPWLVEVDFTLPPFLHRIARHMLSKVAESLQPLQNRPGLQESAQQLANTVAHPDGALAFVARPPRKTTRWLYNDVFSKEDGQEYRHYYTDWSDNIPVCQTLEDVFQLCNTLLGYLGAKIGQDVVLYGTLLRLAHRSLSEDTSEANRSRWLELMKRLLVPALSCTDHNPQMSAQVFELLNLFPTATRYNVYAEWFVGRTSRLPDVRSAFAKNKAETRDVLRRVSNDLVKKQSRALGKIAHASPGVVMMEMISQLESYSNMIPSLVECTRFFSPLAWDVLNWALINSLSGMGRDRMQADGMLTSPWLQALSSFVASLFARHAHLSMSPILQYLASELCVGNSTDLELLEQVLAELAGIRADVEFNDAQVVAMAGGPALQTHILSQLSDTRHLRHKEASRLMKALAGPGLTGQILIAIAQDRQMYQHHESSRYMPLKVLGNNIDKIHAIFMQYLDVLNNNLNPDKFEAAVPEVSSLIGDFGLEPGIALTIFRGCLQSRMEAFDTAAKKQEAEEKKTLTEEETPQTNGDTAMIEAGTTSKTGEDGGDMSELSNSKPVETQAESQEAPLTDDSTCPPDTEVASPWHPVLEPIIQRIGNLAPDLANRVSIPFFVTFWTLNLHDVLVPMDTYQKEIRRVEAQINEITNDRSDVSAMAARDRDKKKRTLADSLEKIKQEPTVHLNAYIAVRGRINNKERLHWFPKTAADDRQEEKAEIKAKHLGLLQECFLPRAMMSAVDAQYAFQMLKILHDNGTPGFSLMNLLYQLFERNKLAALIFQCTANEAQHLGRFLCEVLKYLHTWHADKVVYEKEALGQKTKLPGFVKKFNKDGEPESVMDFEDFRRMLYNFHMHLNSDLLSCFNSGEYMHIRNGIIVLRAMTQVFPAIRFVGQKISDAVEKLSQDDPRSDLKLAAMSVRAPVSKRKDQWALPQTFRLNDPAKDGNKSGGRAASARAETPLPGPGIPKLSAAAPDFQPSTSQAVNRSSRKVLNAGGPEDGEIEDERTPARKSGDVEMRDAPAASASKEPSSGTEDHSPPSQTVGKATPARDIPKTESKSATPAPSHTRAPPSGASTPHRVDSSRPPSHPVPTRPPSQASTARSDNIAGLPKPLPSLPTPRSGGRHSGRADEDYGRLSRPDDGRPGSREESPGQRRRARSPPAGPPRSFGNSRMLDRQPDRPHESRNGREDSFSTSRREAPPQSGRDVRERPHPSSRVSEGHIHPDRIVRMESVVVPPDSQSTALPATRGTIQPQPVEQAQVNPERLRMIQNDTGSNVPNPHSRENRLSDKEHRRERDLRADERAPVGPGPRPDGRRGPAETPRDSNPREPVDLAPSAPRAGRGRLGDMAPPAVESTYGRLNGLPDAPSGPRQANGPSIRGGRNMTAPINTRGHEPPTAPSSTNRPPESPAALRAPSRQPSERNAAGSAPSTPAQEAGPPVHPSRAAQLQQQPPPIQTNLPPPNGPRNLGSPSVGPPSGPRGAARSGPPSGTPTGPSPANNVPPSGPASAREGQRRGERQRASINGILQSGGPSTAQNGQGVNFRGASSRQPSITQPAAASFGGRPTVPTVASSMDPPTNRPSFDGRSTPDDSNNGRTDLFRGRDQSNDGSRRREDEHPGRQHGSRDHSREPRQDDNESSFRAAPFMGDDGRDRRGPREERRSREERPRDGHGRRDGPPTDRPTSDRRGSERQARGPIADTAQFQQAPPPPPPPPPMELNNFDGRESSRRGPRGGGHGHGGDFRGGPPRRDDDRRDGGRHDGAMDKKRRHEETPYDATKRRRSGK